MKIINQLIIFPNNLGRLFMLHKIAGNSAVLAIIVLSGLSGCSLINPDGIAKQPTGNIISYGVYQRKSIAARELSPDMATGYTTVSSGMKHVKSTTTLPAIHCTTFGFQYRLENLPNVLGDTIKVVINHPPMKSYDGKISNVSSAIWPVYPNNGVYENYLFYTLRDPSEILKGSWKLELNYKDKIILSKEFFLNEPSKYEQSELTCDEK